ncbi:MAG: glycogen debranching protein, partial [Actinomycetota bacterium]|nr:glycogen debranching protein [Actinomycetota bacterium]
MRRTPFTAAVLSTVILLPLSVGASASGAPPYDPTSAALRPPELSTTSRLADRRSLVVGDRFFAMGAEDGSYPATGFHTRGEMGGLWTPPIKLLDGIWFKVGGAWLRSSRYTSGWGYQRMELGTRSGVRISRIDFAPNGVRAGLIGLRLFSPKARTLDLAVDAHSELMKVYPWGETTPSQTSYNLQDTGKVDGNSLLFQEQGTPPVANAEPHDYAALVGSRLVPTSTSLGPDHRGPQDPAVVCPASGPSAPPQPPRCDDTAYGKGTGGQLRYRVSVPKGARTIWFSVAGSDQGQAAARRAQAKVLHDPGALLARKLAERRVVDRRTHVSLPGDILLQRSVRWSKQNLADSVQEAHNLAVRVTHAGKAYPAPRGTVAKVRWIGAGWPDYPW